MGDTGSLILGFILAVFTVRFIDISETSIMSIYHSNSPVIALSILFFPLLDTIRIFFIRLFIHKKSPFLADKNHLHHRFLNFGFSHKKTTIIIVFINAVLIASTFYFKNLEIHLQLLLLLFLGTCLYSIIFCYKWYIKLKKGKHTLS